MTTGRIVGTPKEPSAAELALSNRGGLLEALKILQIEITYLENGGAFNHGSKGEHDARLFLSGLKYAMELVKDEADAQR